MVNPYKPSATQTTQSLPTVRYFVSAGLLVLGGLAIAVPNLIYLLAGMARGGMPRRYATYDEEIYLFNNSIPAATAQQITLVTVPLFFGLAALLIQRGLRNRRFARTERI